MKSCHSKNDGDGSNDDRRGDVLDVETEAAPDRRVGRRTFVKGIGATAAAGVGTKYLGSPVGEAEAVLPLLAVGAIGVTAGAVGGIAFGAAFAGPDDSEVASSLDWQTHVDEYTRTREGNLMLDQTLASLERDVQLVENKAREEAIFRIFEQGVDSGTESDATAAAETAIDEAYAVVEESLINTYTIRATRAFNVNKLINDDTGEISTTHERVGVYGPDGSDWDNQDLVSDHPNFLTGGSRTLFDGRTLTHPKTDGSSGISIGPTSSGEASAFVIAKPDPSDYSVSDVTAPDGEPLLYMLRSDRWKSLLSDLESRHSAVKSEVPSMVSSYYQPAKDGEIDLFEAVGPAYLTDTAQTAQDYEEAALALRAMGFPLSDQVVTIEVPTEDGSGLQLTGRLSWTAHMGNALSVGGTLNATNIPGSIYAAINLPEGVDSVTVTNTTNTTTNTTDTSGETGPGAEIIEITDTFEIVSAEGASEVTFADRSLAEATSTNEEINQVFKENYEANEKATSQVYDTATGGGGGAAGDLLGGLSNRELGIAALGAAALAVLFGR